MSTIDVSIGQIVKLKWPERTGNATAIQQSQSIGAHSRGSKHMKRMIEAQAPQPKKKTVSERGWRLSGDDVVELVTRMPPLERLFCAVASSVWLAQWLGIT